MNHPREKRPVSSKPKPQMPEISEPKAVPIARFQLQQKGRLSGG
jgi:hypothetical protein